MSENGSLGHRLKLLVWSVSAGTIVAFFFATNFLAWATNFNPGGSALLFSPLMCGLILGIVTYEYETIQTVVSSIIMTLTTSVLVIVTLMSPYILGIVIDPTGTQLFVTVPQNMMITIILVLPISLLGSILGRLFAENTLVSYSVKQERAVLRTETEEWYRMLEEKLEEKKAALETLEKYRETQEKLDQLNSPDGNPPANEKPPESTS
ncbi:MAG: hypothetical protein PHU53_05530 [Thermoplasmata archaeon]|nr:hypothetical protein [Thermoplasmata archaeon]